MNKRETVSQYTHQYLEKFKPYKGGRWCYEDGIILSGCEYLFDVTRDVRYKQFILEYLDQMIDESGNLAGYNLSDYNIDNVNAGKVLFNAYQDTKEEKLKKAMDLLFSQLESHPRTESGNFWHKKRYPNQIWLDGLYMGQPFYVRYLKEYLGSNDFSDTLNQFKNVRKYVWDVERNLYVHAFDETKSMQWADNETGKAPNVWSRAVGWFAMALVDVMEICKDAKVEDELKSLLVEMVDGMLHYQAENGMWYQVVDQPEVKGNYHETSGTLMMAYAIMKGVRLGYLDDSYLIYGKKAYEGTVEEYLYEENGEIHLGGTCEVAGLDNEKRDGSVAYYLSEKIAIDEAKGVAPLFMSFSEVLRLG